MGYQKYKVVIDMTNPIMMEYVPCALCGNDETDVFFRKRGASVPVYFDIVKCLNCGLVYVNPGLTRAYVRELYTQKYYEGKGLDSSFLGTSVKKERDAEILVKCFKHSFLSHVEKPRLLDVGGG